MTCISLSMYIVKDELPSTSTPTITPHSGARDIGSRVDRGH